MQHCTQYESLRNSSSALTSAVGREFQFAAYERSRWAAIAEGKWLLSARLPVKDWFGGRAERRRRQRSTSALGTRRRSGGQSRTAASSLFQVCSCHSAGERERQDLAGSVNSRASLTAALDRPGPLIERQLPGALRTHSPGHFQSSDRRGDRHANGRFQSTAAIGRRPLEGTGSRTPRPRVELSSTDDEGHTLCAISALWATLTRRV